MNEPFDATRSMHMRIHALQRRSTSLTSDYKPRTPPYYKQAVANFEKRYATRREEDPTFYLTEAQQRNEIEGIRLALVELNAVKANLASQASAQAAQQTKKDRATHGRNGSALTHSQRNIPTTKLEKHTSGFES